MNEERIARGEFLTRAYNTIAGTDLDAPQDLIADLCHYWHSEGNTSEAIRNVLRLGFDQFEQEIEEGE